MNKMFIVVVSFSVVLFCGCCPTKKSNIKEKTSIEQIQKSINSVSSDLEQDLNKNRNK